jgi:hypothetical protein
MKQLDAFTQLVDRVLSVSLAEILRHERSTKSSCAESKASRPEAKGAAFLGPRGNGATLEGLRSRRWFLSLAVSAA